MTENLYERELLLSPLVREDMRVDDIKDFADAIEKVIENVRELNIMSSKSASKVMYDAVRAIDENVQ